MRFITKAIIAEAVQWTGDNLAEIRAFAGDDFLFAEAGRVWVRNSAGPWELALGDWVRRHEDGGPLMVSSAAAFDCVWAPAAVQGRPVSTPR